MDYFQLQAVLDFWQLLKYADASSARFLLEQAFFLYCKEQ